MFNLKQVYATINFDRRKIKLLIAEKTPQKTNCLYYNEIVQEYLDNDMRFINITDLHNKLVKLIKDADEFIGINVKRYIVNISCLPLKIKFNSSPKFFSFYQVLTWDHFNNYINQIKNVNSNNAELTLHVNPRTWFLDNNEYEAFPLSNAGKKISFQYYALTCNRSTIQQWHDLFDVLKIKTIKFTNNSLSWSSLFIDKEKQSNIVVDIKSRSTIITRYRGNEIIDLQTYPLGTNAIVGAIKKILKIDPTTNISSILNNLLNLNYVNEPVSVINKYNEQFLCSTEVTSYDMKKCYTIVIKRFLEDISNLIIAKKVDLEKINLNIDDELYSAINLVNFDLLKLPHKYELVKNEVIGLEEKNVCNLLASINYVHEWQIANELEYSIDNYVSQEISISQTKKNILLKLGVISTKWAAKLGE